MADDLPPTGVLVPHITAAAGGENKSGGLLERIRAAWFISLTSPNTRAAHRRDLERWERFLAEVFGIGLLAAEREHADVWARSLEVAGEAPATRSRRLASASAFHVFAAQYVARRKLGFDLHNPFGTVKRPRPGSRHTRSLEADVAWCAPGVDERRLLAVETARGRIRVRPGQQVVALASGGVDVLDGPRCTDRPGPLAAARPAPPVRPVWGTSSM